MNEKNKTSNSTPFLTFQPIRSVIEKVIETKENLYNAPIVIVDTPMMSIEELNFSIQYMVHNNSVKAVFIDYLGLIQGNSYFQNRHEHQLEIINVLKNMVEEFGITIMADV